MTQRKNTIGSVIAVLALVGLLAWAYQQDKAISPVPATTAAATVQPVPPQVGDESPITVASAAVALASSASKPLPAVDAPVAKILADLKKRADSGDMLASCRLAVELIQCREIELVKNYSVLDNYLAAEIEYEKEGNIASANSFAALQIRQLESIERCAGVKEEEYKQAGKYLKQAARAGVNEALVRYAEGQVFASSESDLALLQDPEFDQWRRSAPALLQRALRQGEPSSVLVLSIAMAEDRSRIGGLIKDDPVAAYEYEFLLAKLRGKRIPAPQGLGVQQVIDARANATRMHREYFDGVTLGKGDSLTSPLTPAWVPPRNIPPRRPCE